jgi:aminoglycoside phosphotransferase (APT) family kinase protein
VASRDVAHREIAARWLGRMHGETAAMAGRVPLPPAGQERYLGHLRSARATILENMENQALTAEDRAVLEAVLGQCDTLEALWPRLERACATCPATLVHADFRPKNLCLRVSDGELALHPIDWEKAGWGAPAADLALLMRRGPASHVSAPAYAETIRDTCRSSTWTRFSVCQASATCSIARRCVLVCAELRFESARSSSGPSARCASSASAFTGARVERGWR